jgi:predicted nuclease of predicted toxin-antitoxin system
MKFLIDAQLPQRFCVWLRQAGHDARHTLDLPMANRTTDAAIIELAEMEDRVIVTKDDDFVRSRLVFGKPKRLLLVATGNITNMALEQVIRKNLSNIVTALGENGYVEIGRDRLVCHDN